IGNTTLASASLLNDGSTVSPYRLTISSRSMGARGGLIIDDGGVGLGVTTLTQAQDARLLFGPGGQGILELVEEEGELTEVEVGWKQALTWSLEGGYLLSGGAKLAIPTEGDGSEEFIPFLAWAQELSSRATLQASSRAILPFDDVDAGELDQSVKPTIAIESDAAEAASALCAAIDATSGQSRDVVAERTAAAAALGQRLSDGMATRFPELAHCCAQLRAAVPPGGVLVDEMTQVGYFARNGYPVEAPGEYLGSGYQGTLGFGYATALGAKVGVGDRPVVSVAGDGGFLYNVGELATAAQHAIGVVAVVFRDDAYGNVLRMQQESTGHEIASRLQNPDLVALAESFGVAGHRVTDLDMLRATLDQAIAAGGPALIDVPIGPQPDLWGLLTLRERLA
ncbi:MAG: hypothetical protein EHM63_09330, partial [Actinobacteria bacterium]